MKKLLLVFGLVMGIGFSAIQGQTGSGKTKIQVNPLYVQARLEGIGASWHSESLDKIDESPEYKWAYRYKNSRGSAWGGNPPVTHEAGWKKMWDYASWLGMSWVSVELSARMYEPERGMFDWENEEMTALYKILDWAQKNNVTVFLRQMWANVKWNSYPGVQPLMSAPKSVNDFANGLATLVNHLLSVKKYTCIKWLCISNEPPAWWNKGDEEVSITPALKAVRAALDQRSISLQISAPDWTELPRFDAGRIDFNEYIGAYDIHIYGALDSARQIILSDWVKWANTHQKPLFLSEMGNMALGWQDENPGPKSFNAAISNAETILKGLEAGVSGFSRWSYTNRGDLDGQWQLIHTWDRQNKKYLQDVQIEPAAFYGFGIITRFCAKNSDVIKTTKMGSPKILSQSIKSPTGKITTYILNLSDQPENIEYELIGKPDISLYLYRANEVEVTRPEYKMEGQKIVLPENGVLNIQIPARTIYTLSQYKLRHKDPGVKR